MFEWKGKFMFGYVQQRIDIPNDNAPSPSDTAALKTSAPAYIIPFWFVKKEEDSAKANMHLSLMNTKVSSKLDFDVPFMVNFVDLAAGDELLIAASEATHVAEPENKRLKTGQEAVPKIPPTRAALKPSAKEKAKAKAKAK